MLNTEAPLSITTVSFVSPSPELLISKSLISISDSPTFKNLRESILVTDISHKSFFHHEYLPPCSLLLHLPSISHIL